MTLFYIKKQIALFTFFLSFFLCSCNESVTTDSSIETIDTNIIQEGGDDTYEELDVVGLPIQLREKDEHFYFINSTTNNYFDTVYVQTNTSIIGEGTYTIWFMNIDRGSIGPFKKIMDTGISYVNEILTDTVYNFRLE